MKFKTFLSLSFHGYCLSVSFSFLSLSLFLYISGRFSYCWSSTSLSLSLSPYVFLVGSAFAGPVSPADTDRADRAARSWASSESLTSCRWFHWSLGCDTESTARLPGSLFPWRSDPDILQTFKNIQRVSLISKCICNAHYMFTLLEILKTFSYKPDWPFQLFEIGAKTFINSIYVFFRVGFTTLNYMMLH